MTESYTDEIVQESDEIALYACGHKGFIKYTFSHLGFKFGTIPRMIEKRDLCPACIWKRMRPQIILCATCGLPILPGNQVAKVPINTTSFEHTFEASPGAYLSCTRCIGIGFTGHWTGKRYRALQLVRVTGDGTQILH